MWHAHEEVLGAYILQEKLSDTSCFEQWIALAIYSPHRFLLRFLKKQVPYQYGEALKNEILSLYHYSVDGVIPIVEIETIGTQLVISSEYREEQLLRDISFSSLNVNEERLFVLALRFARVLYFFHTHGIYWGALLPECLWVRGKLFRPEDFFFLPPGYAVSLPFLVQQTLLEAGDVLLLAPEIKEGKGVSVQGDIYSFGALLQRIGTGVSLAPELGDILSRCSDPHPSQRYRSLEEVIQALESWGEKQGIVHTFVSFDRYQKGPEEKGRREGPTTLQERGQLTFPRSEPREDVLHYFQALSETYRSRYGYEGAEKNSSLEMSVSSRELKTVSSTAPRNTVLSGEESTFVKENILRKEDVPRIKKEEEEQKDSGSTKQEGVPLSGSNVLRANGESDILPRETSSFLEKIHGGVSPSNGKPSLGGEEESLPLYASFDKAPIALRWERHRILLQDIEKVLEVVVRRARSGQGDLRFIVTSDVFSLRQTIEQAAFWSRFRQQVRLVVIEVPSLSKDPLTVNDFVRSLLSGIEIFLARQSSRRRQHLEKALSEACKNVPESLMGKKGAEVPLPLSLSSLHSSFSFQQWLNIFEDPREAASCLLSLSSPRKPLFLMWWGPSELDSALASYLQEFMPFILERPFCFWIWTETTPFVIP
ncbi:MAG: hypothetical protein N2Z76_08025 [Treponemataceae bacterium]|nr:hypothetical protein [Treponemataceae bacterium]